MEYIIMSKKELYMLSNCPNLNVVANNYDYRMQDDAIIICQDRKIRMMITLNIWMSELIKDSKVKFEHRDKRKIRAWI